MLHSGRQHYGSYQNKRSEKNGVIKCCFVVFLTADICYCGTLTGEAGDAEDMSLL